MLSGGNAHVLNLSPPLNMETRWFAPHVAYTMAKVGMSMCVLGMAGEFKRDGIAFNALWPRTTIATADQMRHARDVVVGSERSIDPAAEIDHRDRDERQRDLALPDVRGRREQDHHEHDAAGAEEGVAGEREIDETGHQRGDQDHDQQRHRSMALLEDRSDQQDQHEVAEQVLPARMTEDVGDQPD